MKWQFAKDILKAFFTPVLRKAKGAVNLCKKTPKRYSFLNFSYVCPEPVLVKGSF
jgi:hypothetical protein